jgi:hypothetical protein
MDLKAREDLQKNNKVQTSKTAFPQKCSCAKLLDERKRGRGEKFMEEWYHVYLLLQKIEREAKGVCSLLYVVCRAPHLLFRRPTRYNGLGTCETVNEEIK